MLTLLILFGGGGGGEVGGNPEQPFCIPKLQFLLPHSPTVTGGDQCLLLSVPLKLAALPFQIKPYRRFLSLQVTFMGSGHQAFSQGTSHTATVAPISQHLSRMTPNFF